MIKNLHYSSVFDDLNYFLEDTNKFLEYITIRNIINIIKNRLILCDFSKPYLHFHETLFTQQT